MKIVHLDWIHDVPGLKEGAAQLLPFNTAMSGPLALSV
jgi:hypothetical protein